MQGATRLRSLKGVGATPQSTSFALKDRFVVLVTFRAFKLYRTKTIVNHLLFKLDELVSLNLFCTPA